MACRRNARPFDRTGRRERCHVESRDFRAIDFTGTGFQSPGAILLGELIAWALAEGWRELHFLRGDEDYKYAWGATDRFNAARRLLPERNPPA